MSHKVKSQKQREPNKNSQTVVVFFKSAYLFHIFVSCVVREKDREKERWDKDQLYM